MHRFTALVSKSIEDVWTHLVYKVDAPQHFVPGVQDVEILEKTEAYTIRKMTVVMHNEPQTVVEKITLDANKHLVRFELLEHPRFTGYVLNEAVSLGANSTELTYCLNWADKKDGALVDGSEIIKNAVLLSKSFIEK